MAPAMEPDADSQRLCLTLRPSRAQFERPFAEYVREVCKKHPDIPMFKVVPPKGWAPRKRRFPDLESLRIATPIKQHVFGTGGAFRCLFVEQRGLSVADFKKLSASAAHATPPKGHRQDDLLERAFWSSVTINPPFYGADTPTSFFDESLDYGWNLRDLGDLLKQYDVPPIAGVTTPMAYFGMWKSFFSWHVEDIDLYSINYLHFGAPKVWYCVSPRDRAKFEEMARSHFPELHAVCPAFLRHKDILLSPKTLRNHHISYVQAKQEAGEFIVLNAGAYHSGFNLGFNCAEAVNFALPEWLAMGRAARHCCCTALPDHVHLDMRMFSRGPRASQRLKAKRDLESSDSEDDSEAESSGSEAGSSSENEEEEAQAPPPPKRRRGAAAEGRRKPLADASKAANTGGGRREQQQQQQAGGKGRPAAGGKAAGGAAKRTAKPTGKGASAEDARRRNPFASANRSPTVAKLAAARGAGSKRLAGQQAPAAAAAAAATPPSPAAAAAQGRKRRRAASPAARTGGPAKVPRAARELAAAMAQASRLQGQASEAEPQRAQRANGASPSPHPVKRAMDWMRTLVTGQQAMQDGGAGPALAGGEPLAAAPPQPAAASAGAEAGEAVDDRPCAIVGQDEDTGRKYFYLVQRVRRRSKRRGNVVVRRLREEADGIFRPSNELWEEAESALVPVRTQPWKPTVLRPPGYRLLTLRYRILDTELVD